jgi:hypothetical protein
MYEKYRELLSPIHAKQFKKYFCSAMGYGFSQLGQFIAFGLMFWLAGYIIKNGYDPETGTFDKKPDDVFLALFAIMQGAMHGGMATQFGPDIVKATTASENIFKIIDVPSKINARD